MTTFLIRIEIYGSASVDYKEFHNELEARHIYRDTLSSGAAKYLPDGTYGSANHSTSEEVMEAVHGALRAIGREAGIVVAPVDAKQGGLVTYNLISIPTE